MPMPTPNELWNDSAEKGKLFETSQFVQGETTSTNNGLSVVTHYDPIKHTPIAGTLTGTIYCLDKAIQTIVASIDGHFTFYDIALNDVKATHGKLNLDTKCLSLVWNQPPGDNFIRLQYEYECQTPVPTNNVKSFVTPTFEDFFTHEEIMDIAVNAATACAWDFNTALGDTIKEKYESFYVKIHEITQVLIRKGAKGFFWIVASPEVASMIECCTAGFYPAPSHEWCPSTLMGQQPMGMNNIEFTGVMNGKWRIYKDGQMTYNDPIVIGCNDRREHCTSYARMSTKNLII